MKVIKKGSPKLIKAWAFYDWANSVYPLVISTAIFPIYYSSMSSSFANSDGDISFLGMSWNPTTLYDYTLSISFLIVAFCSPILSGIADYTGNKLKFLRAFCLLVALSVMALFFFKSESTLWVALTFTVLASIGFWGSLVFYNAYLPEVAHPEQQDEVSAKGFMYGYAGSVEIRDTRINNQNQEIFNEWYLRVIETKQRRKQRRAFGHIRRVVGC